MDNYGVSFAPTADNAAMGGKNAQLAGVPQAIQVISMALPRIIGARPVAPSPLLTSQGANGVNSTLLQTILRTLGLPGGTAGPTQPYPMPSDQGGSGGPGASGGGGGAPAPGADMDYTPRIILQPTPPPPEPRNPFPAPGGRRGV